MSAYTDPPAHKWGVIIDLAWALYLQPDVDKQHCLPHTNSFDWQERFIVFDYIHKIIVKV